MKSRFQLWPLWAVVIAASVTTVWFAFAEYQLHQIKARQEVADGASRTLKDTAQRMSTWHNAIDVLLANASTTELASHAWVSEIAILNERGKVESTSRIRLTEVLSRQNVWHEEVPSENESKYRPPETPRHRWLGTTWEGMPTLIVCQMPSKTKSQLCVLLNRPAVLSTLVAQLNTESKIGNVVFAEVNGPVVSVSGPDSLELVIQQTPWSILHLPAPLDSLELRYIPSVEQLKSIGLSGHWAGYIAFPSLVIVVFVLLALFAQDRMTRSHKEAEKKVNFASRVSHELRTPLTNIRLYAELLDDELQGEPESQKKLHIILSEVHRLGRLIDNVLSVTKSKNVVVARVLLNDCIARVVDAYALSFREKNMNVIVSLVHDIWVMGNADSIEQILANTLSNAEKYAARGTVDIEFTEVENEVRVSMKDEGAGIASEFHTRIFEPYFRVNDSISEGVSGTGLGLSICRDLAAAMGGSYSLTRSHSNGSTFTLTLMRAT